MQQQEQGNGLIGGGIGGAIGLGGAYFGGAKALSDLVDEDSFYNSHLKFYNDLKQKYGVATNDELKFSAMNPTERKVLNDLHDQAEQEYKKARSRVNFLTMLGVPITTALLGSTLTD